MALVSEPAAEAALLAEARAQLEAYFAGRLHRFDLPIALRGPAFQCRLWFHLATIPYGQTRSYGEIARELGSIPRAVGTACGANPLPILLPCHRVVGADGSLGGFSGGYGRASKAALLALERAEREPELPL